jgi:hypothetical protein
VILPLAHHNAIVALPVFAPALVVILFLLVHRMRERRHWDEEETEHQPPRETAKKRRQDVFLRSRVSVASIASA